jgi:ABC-type nitrate/sulfonate/bicarbonate transport system ATPase subunit
MVAVHANDTTAEGSSVWCTTCARVSLRSTMRSDAVSLSVGAGEFFSLIGPSGCGKSPLLRLIAGLDPPTSGELWIDSDPMMGPSAERGLVFQDPNLFPWLTVRRNIQAGLVARGVLHKKRHEVD